MRDEIRSAVEKVLRENAIITVNEGGSIKNATMQISGLVDVVTDAVMKAIEDNS